MIQGFDIFPGSSLNNRAKKMGEESMCTKNQNPFEQTVEEQLAALRRQNKLGSWGIEESVFARLAKTAPEWPEGRDAYRSFRIRFGEGRDGVIKTFEAHVNAVKHTHDNFWRWNGLLSGEHPFLGKQIDRLRLLAGNGSHAPMIEWIIIPDLSANLGHGSINSVRGVKSLADAGLVVIWLVPDRVRAIDYKEWCAWFLAGYEVNEPRDYVQWWTSVPCVQYSPHTGTGLQTWLRCYPNPGFAAPSGI
ncbi:hypothetical protein HN699_01590 [Candidatus Uhrbacteria bacterium]|jgi:hypothetical protein|nr:hypothetical protein [Candidatus Uhrbacteria bacterium]